MLRETKTILEILVLIIVLIKPIFMKKGFFKTALTVLKYLVEEWDTIYPLIKELVDEIKEQNKNDQKPNV